MGVFDPGLQAVTCRSIILGQLELGLIGITIRSFGGGGLQNLLPLEGKKKKPFISFFEEKKYHKIIITAKSKGFL